MFGCSEKSEDIVSNTAEETTASKEDIIVDEGTTADKNVAKQVQESANQSKSKSDLNSYLELIGKPLEGLESSYGQASLVYTMYGGDIYYYEKQGVGFGVDTDIVSSVLIYRGELDNKIAINMSLEEALETLELSQSDVGDDGEGGEVLFYQYNSYESYLRFYDGILKEILIKKG